MSNNFPSVPTDYQLQSIDYQLNFNVGVSPGPALTFAGVSTSTWGGFSSLGAGGGMQFTFATPGALGSFDQTAAETALAKVVADIFQLMTDITGVAVATLEQNFSVARRWTWVDAAGNTATYTDTMPLSS
jgi:hypothetical protein